jgi:hypothetical protein
MGSKEFVFTNGRDGLCASSFPGPGCDGRSMRDSLESRFSGTLFADRFDVDSRSGRGAKEMMKAGFALAFLNQPLQHEQLPSSADHLDWLARPRIAGAVPVCLQSPLRQG